MNTQRSIRLSLAGAVALGLSGFAMAGVAQQTPSQQTIQQAPPPPASTTPMPVNEPPSAGGSVQFMQGTESSVTFPMQNGHGTVTVHSGMPVQVGSYGPPPAFATLDTNHDGRISEAEAQAYPPLDSDFLYASGGGKSISRAGYKNWVKEQH